MSAVQPPAPTDTPPGWYPSTSAGVLRYWDGIAWTEHHAAQPVHVTVQPQNDHRMSGQFLPTPVIMVLVVLVAFAALFIFV
jgi:hypothetical protein